MRDLSQGGVEGHKAAAAGLGRVGGAGLVGLGWYWSQLVGPSCYWSQLVLGLSWYWGSGSGLSPETID